MRRLLTVFTITLMMTGIATAAGKGTRGAGTPNRYLPGSADGAIVQLANDVDGRVWSAWSYRNGAEYDLALSFDTGDGLWSDPLLIGLDDGINQRQPAIAVDGRGATYVAYADDNGAILITALQPGGLQWTAPATIAQAGHLSAPNLIVLGDTLIVAYRDGDGVSMKTLPVLEPDVQNTVRSIYDGPDPTTGHSDGDDDDNDDSATEQPSIYGSGSSGGVSVRPLGDAWSQRGGGGSNDGN